MQLEELLDRIRANRDQTTIVLSEYWEVVDFDDHRPVLLMPNSSLCRTRVQVVSACPSW
jgi:hypothetical protein